MNFDNKKPGRKPLYVYYIIAAIIIILLNVLLLPAIEGRKVQTTEYSVFLTGVEKGYVKTAALILPSYCSGAANPFVPVHTLC